MQTEPSAAGSGVSKVDSSSRPGASGRRGRRRGGPRSRAYLCLLSLAVTVLTGLFLHGQVPHGDSWQPNLAGASGSTELEVVHVFFAACLTVSVVWHMIDKRRWLLAVVRRRNTKSAWYLFAGVGLTGLLVASILTGVGDNAPGHVEHHTAVSVVLLTAYGWHGVRRLVRTRRTPRRMVMEAQR